MRGEASFYLEFFCYFFVLRQKSKKQNNSDELCNEIRFVAQAKFVIEYEIAGLVPRPR
jgi:hypothetical protein